MNNGKLVYMLILLGIFVLGLSLLNLADLSFQGNTTAYILILGSLALGFVSFLLSKYNHSLSHKLIALNGFVGLALLYVVLEVILNLSEANTTIRFLKIIPASCYMLALILMKRDLKRKALKDGK